jgi:hypothetical protein
VAYGKQIKVGRSWVNKLACLNERDVLGDSFECVLLAHRKSLVFGGSQGPASNLYRGTLVDKAHSMLSLVGFVRKFPDGVFNSRLSVTVGEKSI